MEDVRDCDEPGNEKSATDAVLLAGLRSSLIRGGQFRLHDRLLKERNLCQKTRISGNVVSTVSAMEPSDFAGEPLQRGLCLKCVLCLQRCY